MFALGIPGISLAAAVEPLGINLGNYDYPAPVSRLTLDTPRGPVSMAYMDIAPGGDRDKRTAPTIVLLHGKNFSGAYWGETAHWLAERGYRVVIPDQVGFGKSDKPATYSYTFAHLAANTQTLLDHLGIDHAVILGHSMGGMLATRFALMYPDTTRRLILVDPIGLEDWKAKGVPYRGMNAWYARDMKKDYAGIQAYQKQSYYHGTWKPAYAPWAKMLAGMYASPDKDRLAWVSAATYDMIYNEPVVYEFRDLTMPTTLIVGALDRTALGKDLVSNDKAATLGDYPALSKNAVAAMPHGQRILLDGLGHLPFIEAPERFRAALADTLDEGPAPTGR
ncbi:alpha/beta hydrolase [Salinisphaera sp. Q1T1-3]|nr:alpha/beta hydrolase [Salinisphaera sp. Q1T1-3]